MTAMGPSQHLVAFLKGPILERLKSIEVVLRGDRYASESEGRRTTGIWAQIDENRAVLELLQRHAPQLLVDHPELVSMLAHRDAWLADLAEAAGVTNPWWLRPPKGWPRPWPDATEAPGDALETLELTAVRLEEGA